MIGPSHTYAIATNNNDLVRGMVGWVIPVYDLDLSILTDNQPILDKNSAIGGF